MDISEAVRSVSGGTEVEISVSPRSDRPGADGVDEWRKRLTVRVRAPPLDGRANKDVEELFKELTGFKCTIVRGQTSRQKTVLVGGDVDTVLQRLRDAFER